MKYKGAVLSGVFRLTLFCAELVKRSFQEHSVGYQITHLSDGVEALEYLFQRGDYADKRKHPRPHFILLDLRLPRIGAEG